MSGNWGIFPDPIGEKSPIQPESDIVRMMQVD